ncbi:MAG: inorganic pyrophosphatase [Flavobacteriales bacterium]|nr:inorganic pyrophosphatase [Flavobacteriales bacterium]|tara:strand:- start:160 stop:810 length:651 start_codon:yes stop_codon:yes gene_type:complete
MKKLYFLFLVSVIFSCTNSSETCESKCSEKCTETKNESDLLDYSTLPFKNSEGTITAVVEIPAGTNHKYEYNYDSKSFVCEIRNGKPRVVNYLPYIGNYGFIPGTFMDPSIGGDGDALDVLILSEAMSQGSVVEIKPIGILKLMDDGEEDHKVIAVPAKDSLNTLGVNSFDELPDNVKEILKTWFTSYKRNTDMVFQNWEGDSLAMLEIEKWVKKK